MRCLSNLCLEVDSGDMHGRLYEAIIVDELAVSRRQQDLQIFAEGLVETHILLRGYVRVRAFGAKTRS